MKVAPRAPPLGERPTPLPVFTPNETPPRPQREKGALLLGGAGRSVRHRAPSSTPAEGIPAEGGAAEGGAAEGGAAEGGAAEGGAAEGGVGRPRRYSETSTPFQNATWSRISAAASFGSG